jgi:hypothetical protein
MITGIFAFVGAMIGSIAINYILHEPNERYDESYRNSGHHGPKD